MIALHLNAIYLDHKLVQVTHLKIEIWTELIANCRNEAVLVQDVFSDSLAKAQKNLIVYIHEKPFSMIQIGFLQRNNALRAVTNTLAKQGVYPSLLKPVAMLYLKVANWLF